MGKGKKVGRERKEKKKERGGEEGGGRDRQTDRYIMTDRFI